MVAKFASVAILEAFVPVVTDQAALAEFAEALGGATTLPGRGAWWDSARNLYAEEVQVWRYVVPCDGAYTKQVSRLLRRFEKIGGRYLAANPNEQIFFATIQVSGKALSLTINQEK